MNTLFMLMSCHGGQALLSLEEVRKGYFASLSMPVFLVKLSKGDIALPVVRMEESQKSVKMVHLQDLATFIDKQREVAQKELRQLLS